MGIIQTNKVCLLFSEAVIKIIVCVISVLSIVSWWHDQDTFVLISGKNN